MTSPPTICTGVSCSPNASQATTPVRGGSVVPINPVRVAPIRDNAPSTNPNGTTVPSRTTDVTNVHTGIRFDDLGPPT